MWGGLPIALKVVLGDMDTITVTWYRFSISALIAIVWYGRRSLSAVRRMLRPPLWPLTLLAVAGLLANYIFYLIGLDHTTAEAAQILIQLAPLMLLLGSVWLFKESFSVPQWLGVIAFSLGLLLFFHHRLLALSTVDESYLLGLFMLLLAAAAWAAYGLAQKQLLKHVGAQDLLILIYVAGAVCFLPASSPGQIQQLDGLGLHWFEEPVWPPENYTGLAAVRATGRHRIAAGENAGSLFDFVAMHQAGAIDIAQPDVAKTGGVTELLKIARFCEAHGLTYSPHCALFGPGQIATIHLTAAEIRPPLFERLYLDFEAELYGDAAVVRDGRLRVPAGPGLGVDPDPAVIDRYRVA